MKKIFLLSVLLLTVFVLLALADGSNPVHDSWNDTALPQYYRDVADWYGPGQTSAEMRQDFMARRLQRQDSRQEPATPMGVGYGYYYLPTAQDINWKSLTVLDYHIIVPEKLGGDIVLPRKFIYLTSTNHSNTGTETFMSYFQQTPVEFKIFSWVESNAGRDPWVVTVTYPDLSRQYIFQKEDATGTMRPVIHIKNSTELLKHTPGQLQPYSWRNQSYVYNSTLKMWDLLWEETYTTATKEEVTYEASDQMGSWGPILETNASHTQNKPIKPLGFIESKLFIDDSNNAILLSPNNTYSVDRVVSRSANDGIWPLLIYTGYKVLGLVPNHSWTVQ
jgi:hypothetical protein